MSNYKPLKRNKQVNSQQISLYFGPDSDKQKPITLLISDLYDSIDLSFFNQYYKSDKITGGRPNTDYKTILKLFTLSVYDNISVRQMINQILKIDSDYSYLAREFKSPPSRAIFSKFLNFLDTYIDDIFAQTIEVFSSEIELNLETLFCDGTVFEAHNNRHKIIRIGNVEKSDDKWG